MTDKNIFEAILTSTLDNRQENFQPHGFGASTEVRPGSPEKIEAMAQRANGGVELWHGEDLDCFRD